MEDYRAIYTHAIGDDDALKWLIFNEASIELKNKIGVSIEISDGPFLTNLEKPILWT